MPVDRGAGMNLRPYTALDLDAVVALFAASVHGLGAPHYSAVQLEAWARELAVLKTVLLHDENGLAGFVAYDEGGHIDLLYTRPGAQRRGVASSLLRHVQRELPCIDLFTESSSAAKAFFLRQGFDVVEAQQVVRRGVALQRFAMRKAVAKQKASLSIKK